VGLVLFLLALPSAAASAAVPEGPRLAVMEWKLKKPDAALLVSVAADGSGRRRLVGGGKIEPTLFGAASWSADGSSFAFSAFSRGHGKKAKSKIYLASADGTDIRPVPGTVGGTDPVLSPDGASIAFSRSRTHFKFNPKDPLDFHSYASTSAWAVRLGEPGSRRLSPWRNGLHVSPTAFSPDGSRLALERIQSAEGGPEVLVRVIGSGATMLLAREAEGAAFSPDGTRIALISYRDRVVSEANGDGPRSIGELYVANADGSGLRRLTHTPEWQESDPSWDPSGQRLAYTRSSAAEWIVLAISNLVMEINADGTCATTVLGKPRPKNSLDVAAALYAPTWQLGSGREAGPISC
jgi:Tol biopolymer transport system component